MLIRLTGAAALSVRAVPAIPNVFRPMTTASQLPCSRPSLMSAPRKLQSTQWSSEVLPYNMLRMVIDHEPINGVTGQMVSWAWSNPDLRVKAPGSDTEQPM